MKILFYARFSIGNSVVGRKVATMVTDSVVCGQ